MKRTLLLLFLLNSLIIATLSAQNALYLQGSQSMPGDTTLLVLSVSATEKITSFEADVTFPKGLTIISAAITPSDLPTDHIVRMRYLPLEKKVHIACWSPSNACFNHRVSLTVAVDDNLPKGSYTLHLSDVLLVMPDGSSLTSEGNTALIEINNDKRSSNFAAFFANAPVSQAWRIKNVDTGLFLHLNSTANTITMKNFSSDSHCQQFFLEPAYDLGEGLFYLRNVEGYYLCCTSEGSSYDISIERQPNNTSAFIMTETGDRTYSLTIAGDTKKLAASESAIDSEVCASTKSSLCHWQFYKIDGEHTAYLERLCNTTSRYVGLTHGEVDFYLRCLLHSYTLDLAKGMDDMEAISAIDKLAEAVVAALIAYTEGDTTTVNWPWIATTYSSQEIVISTSDADGKTIFLTMDNGSFCLSDQFTIIQYDELVSLFQDAFYNPYLDTYAIRIGGDDPNGRGTYLTADILKKVVSDTTVTALFDSLAQWTILTLPQAVGRFLTLSGKSGTNVSWNFDLTTGTLSFNGQLRTNSYARPEARPWHLYRKLIRHVAFSGKISLLGANLLADCTNIETIIFISDIVPTAGEGTFDGIPYGIDLYAPNPEDFEGFLPLCETHFLVKIQDIYVYDGTFQKPMIDGSYDASVKAGIFEKDAGSYTSTLTITITINGKNYEHTGPFSYTILPAPLTLTTLDYTRTYGSKNPTFTVTANGLKGEDNYNEILRSKPIATCEANEKSPVDTYPIIVSGAELRTNNYELNYQHGTLTVRRKNLSIIADNQMRYEGEPNPVLTFSCVGFTNDEDVTVLTEQPILSCEADSTSGPGKYPIIVSGGAAANYSIKTANGVLTILNGSRVISTGMECTESPVIIYDLLGRCIKTNNQPEKPLSQGIYFINGKKTYIK